MIGRAALDPPRRLPELCERAFRPAEQFVEAGQRFARLQAGLHRRPLFGETRLLAFLRRQLLDLGARMFEPLAVALGRRGLGARLTELGFDPRHLRPRARPRDVIEPAEQRRAVRDGPWVEQSAIVVLAVDLDRQGADFAQQSGRHRRAADEGAAAAVALRACGE